MWSENANIKSVNSSTIKIFNKIMKLFWILVLVNF